MQKSGTLAQHSQEPIHIKNVRFLTLFHSYENNPGTMGQGWPAREFKDQFYQRRPFITSDTISIIHIQLTEASKCYLPAHNIKNEIK